jgi:PTH1 family peptidyl-tRNA hydrolase
MKLIVGLGNPGEKYSGNRHNIGFMAVDEMARGYGFGPWKKRFQGYTAEGQIGAEKCLLLKPSTYMNESGRAVGEAMRFYKLPLSDVIVVHDEIDLKPGVIRVKRGGGNAGHNGLKSISAHAGNDYLRVRLGVDHPGDKALVAHYVLQDFAKSDHAWLAPLLEGVARGMTKLVEGSEAAFLSEAARGRKPSTEAAKLNGSSSPEAVQKEPENAPEEVAPPPSLKIEGFPETEAETLATIAAAAARTIEPLPAPQVALRGVNATPTAAADAETAVQEEAIVDYLAEAVFEAEPVSEPEPVAEAVLTHDPLRALEPEPAPEAAQEPVHAVHTEPVPEPVHAHELQRAPEPEPVPQPEIVPAAQEPVDAVHTEPVPEPVHAPELQPASEPEPIPEPEIVSAFQPIDEPVHAVHGEPDSEPEPVIAEAVKTEAVAPAPEPAPAFAQALFEPEPAPEPQPVEETAPVPEPATAPPPEAIQTAKPAPLKEEALSTKGKRPAEPESEPRPKKKGNIFSRWFRSRVRGGTV